MNEERIYAPADAWHPAVYVGAGPLQGTEGIAQHERGDWWRFKYLRPAASACGPRIEVVRAFRTEVELRVVL